MSRTAFKVFLVAAMGAALLAFAAACGGGDDDEATADTAAAVTTAAEEIEEAATTEEESSSGGTDMASAENCKELGEIGAKVSAALGSGGSADTEKTKEFLDEFADKAPEEIRDDFQIIADAYGKIVEALGDVNVAAGETPGPEALAKLQALATEIDQEELTQANNNITAWVTENCTTN